MRQRIQVGLATAGKPKRVCRREISEQVQVDRSHLSNTRQSFSLLSYANMIWGGLRSTDIVANSVFYYGTGLIVPNFHILHISFPLLLQFSEFFCSLTFTAPKIVCFGQNRFCWFKRLLTRESKLLRHMLITVLIHEFA